LKLRFDKNSLRLRIKKSDLEKLREQNFVLETVNFPNGAFSFQLLLSDQVKNITALINPFSIQVSVPSSIAIQWINNDVVGIYHTLQFDNHSLDIIIEKDFPCKDKSEEENRDTFIQIAEKNQDNPC
jgi:hypothetical protein